MKFFLWASGNDGLIQYKFQLDRLYRSRDIRRSNFGFPKNSVFGPGLAAKILDGSGRDRSRLIEWSVLYILAQEWAWDLKYFASCDGFSERIFEVHPPIATHWWRRENVSTTGPRGNFWCRFRWHMLFSWIPSQCRRPRTAVSQPHPNQRVCLTLQVNSLGSLWVSEGGLETR